MNHKIPFTLIAIVTRTITPPTLIFRRIFRVPKSCADLVCRRGLFGDS